MVEFFRDRTDWNHYFVCSHPNPGCHQSIQNVFLSRLTHGFFFEPSPLIKTMKTTFIDSYGNLWDLALNYTKADRVEASDFSEIVDEDFTILEPSKELSSLLLRSSRLNVAIAYAIIRPEFALRYPDLPEEECQKRFTDAVNGKVVQEIKEALAGSLADFFQDQGTIFLVSLEVFRQKTQKLAAEALKLKPDLEAAADREIDQNLSRLKKVLADEQNATSGDASANSLGVIPISQTSPAENSPSTTKATASIGGITQPC